MPKYVVAPVAEIPPGTQRKVEVGGRSVAVFNVEGTFRALRDICPHKGAELSAGVVVGSVSATEPGCYVYDASRTLVRCPWHGWEYDLVTGQSWVDPEKQRVRPYPVTVEAGETLFELDENAEGPQPGPYIAETIKISVEDEYVVIDLDA
jgi:3-phenylpropionate/trans-cinnamate dioxygenase ferredoxin subunit